jgi:hypothetical protein
MGDDIPRDEIISDPDGSRYFQDHILRNQDSVKDPSYVGVRYPIGVAWLNRLWRGSGSLAS